MKPRKKIDRYFRDCSGVGNYRHTDHSKLREAPFGNEDRREIDPRFGHMSAKMSEFERVRKNVASFNKGLGAMGDQFADKQLNQRLMQLFLKMGREADGLVPACRAVSVKDHVPLLGFDFNAAWPLDRDLVSASSIVVNRAQNVVVLKVSCHAPWVPTCGPKSYRSYALVLGLVRLVATDNGRASLVPAALYQAEDGYGGYVQSQEFSLDLEGNRDLLLGSYKSKDLVLNLSLPVSWPKTTGDALIVLLGIRFFPGVEAAGHQTCHDHCNKMAVVGVF